MWDLFYWLSRRAAACTPASNRALLGTAVCGVSIVIRLGPNSFVLILFCDLTNVLNNQTKRFSRTRGQWLVGRLYYFSANLFLLDRLPPWHPLSFGR